MRRYERNDTAALVAIWSATGAPRKCRTECRSTPVV
jgi:hypothetical protein